jgi:uncharacterized membrane protein (DUF4010 family)
MNIVVVVVVVVVVAVIIIIIIIIIIITGKYRNAPNGSFIASFIASSSTKIKHMFQEWNLARHRERPATESLR